jgi:putative acetyltransferase
MEIEIRDEEAKDIDQVRDVLRAAFPTDAESKLVDALRANGKSIVSLVAIQKDRVVGHILFSLVSTAPPGETKVIGLAPVAVRPEVQSRGIGSRLIHEGLQRCRELRYDYCVVLGNPAYYQRFGFETASPFGIQNEYGVDHEFMVIRLSSRDLAPGLVRYATEFSLFSV